MRIITYFSFTLLSILIQFSLMDYIQERMKIDNKSVDLNATSQKKQLREVLKEISQKPHALYYQTHESKLVKNTSDINSNISLPELPLVTTEISTVIFDVLFDENTSITEISYTTEPLFTSTEFDNITEILSIEKPNQTLSKPNVTPEKTLNRDCYCNLLHKVCDINCCCDMECSENDIKLFSNCHTNENIDNDGCLTNILNIRTESYILNNLFCVIKTNLPDKRDLNPRMYDEGVINQFLKWKSNAKNVEIHKFTNKMYKIGDPIWILQNGSTSYMDLPFPTINNYCTGRKPITFLHEEIVKCNVNLRDVEMIQIMKKSKQAHIISATPLSLNTSVTNCSTLHCINWTLIFCDSDSCMHFNKSLHEPSCTESMCTNLALRMDYIFYYYDSKIINATIKFYVQNASLTLPLMPQEINVKFLIANDSIDHITKFSGAPGYRHGLPIIVSFAEKNHTENFYKSNTRNRYLPFPNNRNGMCVPTDITESYIQFGLNKRVTCKYFHKNIHVNHTLTCKSIQRDINKLLRLNDTLAISPYGNPQDTKDEDWILLQMEASDKEPVYGEFHDTRSQLNCFNLVTRISLTFGFANVNKKNGHNKILGANLDVTRKNISFDIGELSTLLTFDINFIDLMKPSVFEYAGGPHLNIYLPKDFFFPFPSNDSAIVKCNMYMLFSYCSIILFYLQIK